MKTSRLVLFTISFLGAIGIFAVAANGAREGDFQYKAGDRIGLSPDKLDDGLAKEATLVEGTMDGLDADSAYGRSIGRILGLDHPRLARQTIPAKDGDIVTFDTVDLLSQGPGYQASIYHGIPEVFAPEHNQAGFPKIQTAVGTAWYSSFDTAASVALVNDRTGIAVRVKYYNPTGELPPIKELMAKAIELSNDAAVQEEVK